MPFMSVVQNAKHVKHHFLVFNVIIILPPDGGRTWRSGILQILQQQKVDISNIVAADNSRNAMCSVGGETGMNRLQMDRSELFGLWQVGAESRGR